MGSRILLADDSITIQKVVNLTFADEGIEVVSVSNGDQAEKRLGEINPDLVLADIFMPGKNGYELCEYIKQSPQYRGIPVVLLVGAFEPFDQGEARRVQADAHLTKPFESRTLVETVRALIDRNVKPRTGALGSQSAPLPFAPIEAVGGQGPAESPFSFDLAAMAGAPEPAHPSDLADSFAEASPLDLDDDSGGISHADPASVDVRPTRELWDQFQFSGQPADSTDSSFAVDSSVDQPPVHVAEAPVASAEGEALGGLSFSTEPHGVGFKSGSAGVPSAFGYGAQDVVLDFDTSDAPPPPAVDTSDSFNVDFSVGAQTPINDHGAQASFDASSSAVAVDEPLEDFLTQGAVPPHATVESELSVGTASDPADSPLADLAPEVPQTPASLWEGPGLLSSKPLEAESPSSGAPEFNQSPARDQSSFESGHQVEPPQFAALDAEPSVDSASPAWSSGSSQVGDGFAILPNASPETTAARFTTAETWSADETQFATIEAGATAEVDQPAAVAEPSLEVTPQTAEAAASTATPSTAAPAEPTDPASATALSEQVIGEIVRRVTAEITDKVVREIAWEVVPDCVERVVERLARESLGKR